MTILWCGRGGKRGLGCLAPSIDVGGGEAPGSDQLSLSLLPSLMVSYVCCHPILPPTNPKGQAYVMCKLPIPVYRALRDQYPIRAKTQAVDPTRHCRIKVASLPFDAFTESQVGSTQVHFNRSLKPKNHKSILLSYPNCFILRPTRP